MPAGATIGVAVADRNTGTIALGRNANTPFYSASVVKLIIAIEVYDKARAGAKPVADVDQDLVFRALSASDDEAMNELWGRYDGPAAISSVAKRLGLTETRPPDDPSQWGAAVISAADVVRVYNYVLDTMNAADRSALMAAMAAAPDSGADGFVQRFGLLSSYHDNDPAVKQGWMCCYDGRIDLHSTGVVDEQRYVVAMLSSQPEEFGWDTSRDNLTSAAEALKSALDPRP